LGIVLVATGAFTAGGCKKKPADGKAGVTAGSSTDAAAAGTAAGTATGTAGGGGDSTSNAASGDLSGLKPVTECPKSLEGSDSGLDRTIKKECGVVAVKGQYQVDGSLTLEAGVQLAFQPGASMVIGYNSPSKLKINGTTAEPVKLIAGGDQVAGSWAGLRLSRNAARSTITGLVIEHAGGEDGALHIEAIDVTLKDVLIKDATDVGLWVADDASIKDATGLHFEKAGAIAASLPAASIGGLGEGNTFGDGGFVQIRGGAVHKDATWRNPGTYYIVEGNVQVDGDPTHAALTIAAGTELRFRPGAYLQCGYYNAASVEVAGTKDKPVIFKSAGDDVPGAWRGLSVQGKGEMHLTGAVVQAAGEDEDAGAVAVYDGGVLTIKDSTIKTTTVGVVATGNAGLKSIANTHFEGNKLAIRLRPDQVGALAADNTYAAGQLIEIMGGAVEHDQTWLPQAGAEEQVKEIVDVSKAKLTLAAGLELRFDGNGVVLRVGYYEKSALRATGTKDKPVVLRGVRDEAGAWGGLQLEARSDDNLLDNVIIQDTDHDAAVTVAENVHADLKTVTFKRVKAGVASQCTSKVTTAGLKIDGGAKAEVKPEGC
jgi:hypothetical protein